MKTNKYSGTKTEQNLRTAFSGESEARNKYTFFASTAKKEGYEQIAALFQKTADNEKEHAKMWFKELQASAPPPTICSPPLRAKTTSGPTCTILSPRPQRKRLSRAGAEVPPRRRDRAPSRRALPRAAAHVETAKVFEKSEVKVWECRNCGHIVVGTKAPTSAPPATTPELLRSPRGELLRIVN